MSDVTLPTMSDLESSNIASAGYDAESQALHVKFKSGSHYKYGGVPQDAVDAFLAAPSKGKRLNSHIIGKYDHQRIS